MVVPLDEAVGGLWQHQAANEQNDGRNGCHTHRHSPAIVMQVLCACTQATTITDSPQRSRQFLIALEQLQLNMSNCAKQRLMSCYQNGSALETQLSDNYFCAP